MKHTSRVLAAVVATTALTFTGVHTADAKPAHAGSHAKAEKAAKSKGGKGAMTKLERDVARKVAQLGRTVSEQRLRRVDPEHAATVEENVAADQAALEALLAPTPAETTTTEATPATDVRATLKTYRAENYRLAVNILRQAAKAGQATEAETTEAEAVAVDESVALALALTATSPKSDVKAARAAFLDAGELLEDDADETEEAEEAEDAEETESATPEVDGTVTP